VSAQHRDTPIRPSEVARRLLEAANHAPAADAALLLPDPVAQFLRLYANRPATQRTYARILAHWICWLKEAGSDYLDATTEMVEEFSRRPTPAGSMRAPNTAALEMACLTGFYRDAAGAGYIAINPADGATRPKPPPAPKSEWDIETARQLLRTARRTGDREELFVLLFLGMGLHASEAIGIDIEHLGQTRDAPVLRINADHPTKSATVRLHPVVLDAARRVADGREAGPLFITSSGARSTRYLPLPLIKRVGARVGLDDLTARDLRGGFVALAVRVGASTHEARRAARYVESSPYRRYDRVPDHLDRDPSLRLIDALLAE